MPSPSTLTTRPAPRPNQRPTPLRSAKSHRPNVLSLMLRGARGRHWTFAFGAVLLALVLLVLVLTPWIAPHDPAAQDLGNRLTGPSGEHWFGTDHLGRDVLSRLMWGGRFSVTIAAITLLICAVTGSVIGALAARRGGWVDELVMRSVDVLICFPDVVIALFLIALFGTGYGTLIAALTISGWTPFARLMRGLALEINAKDYVEAAEILGSPKSYIVFRHVIPNASRPGGRDGLPPVRAQADHRRRPVLPRPRRPTARLRLGRDAPRRPALHGTSPQPRHPARRSDLPHRAQRDHDRPGPRPQEAPQARHRADDHPRPTRPAPHSYEGEAL